jgi:WD40 repeat protein/serine/threonine protein kinase
MPAESLSLKEVFLAALTKAPVERAAWLEQVCGRNTELRRRVELMLAAHDTPQSLLDRPAFAAIRSEAATGGFADASAERAGTVIGPYKLLQQIGEGGMGTVYMAEQTQPVQRKVALKIIKAGMDSRQVIARFEAERQALALMDHPNIAKVFDGGTTESGRPYVVMELVKGESITKYFDEHRLTPRQRLELFLSVCQAIQHAHQKGIIHRDIKATNILIAPYDGKPVVKVIDFGIAKATGQRLTDKTLFTEFGAVVGTLEYMSPEQAELNNQDIDTRSDIYSLGVLLYEVLTGTTPLDRTRLKQSGFAELLRIIREEEPPRPSTRLSEAKDSLPSISAQRRMEPAKLTKLVRGELDWIVMKALEKDRNRRYETANAFAADVQRYLNDEAVLACPPSAMYRFRKFARRNKVVLATTSVVALALLLAAAALATSTVVTARALQAQTRAKDDLRRDAYFHRITLAYQDLSADNLGRALKLLEECPEDLREWEWHYLMRLCKVEPLVLRNMTEANGLAFSPDGKRLASAGGDGAIKIWNSRTGNVIQTIAKAHADSVVCVAFHTDGKHLASVGADRRVKVWDLTTEEEVFNESCDVRRKYGTAYTVAFSPRDGQQLAAGSAGTVRVWDWKSHQILHNLHAHDFHSIPVAFSGDGRLVTGVLRDSLKLWDPKTGGLLRTFAGHRHPISSLAFNTNGERLASASYDRTVKVWDTTTGKLLHTLDLHTGNVECVAFSPDGRRLASGGEDKTVRIWDSTTGREVLGLRGHTGRCGCVAFSLDGRLASASTDGTIRIWDASPLRGDEGQEILTFTQHSDEIRSVAFSPVSPDGQMIASSGTDGFVKVWDAITGRESVSFIGHTVIVFGVAWHPDGKRIATAGVDGRLLTVKVWGAGNRREVFELPAGGDYHAVAFGPDGRHLVTGTMNGAVQVWDARKYELVGTLGTHKVEIRGVVFSLDGKHLASASGDGEVKLWDATRLDKEQDARLTLRARVPGPSVNVAFSPDGRRLATGGEDNSVKIWDVQTGRELDKPLRGHNGEVYTVAFSPDGRWIASGGEDSAVKVWDSHTGELVRSFRGHRGLISSVAFSPDGRRLASGSRDKTVKIWDVTPLSGEVRDR